MHRTIWIVGSHHNWSELDCIWICASNGTCHRNCRICWNELTDCHRKETLFPNRKPSSDLVAVCMVTVIAKQRHERKTHSQTLTKQLNDVLAGTRFQSHSTVSCLSPICLPNKWRDIVDAFQLLANIFVSCVAMHCISIGHTIMTTHLMVIFLIGICFVALTASGECAIACKKCLSVGLLVCTGCIVTHTPIQWNRSLSCGHWNNTPVGDVFAQYPPESMPLNSIGRPFSSL